ncbi:Ca2+-binding RTX toxin-like protein, partial [Mesorhizobium robiniae]
GVNEDTIKNIENVTGGSAADALNGDGLANTLIGNAGNDILKGFAGNDTFVGGAGNDTMDGGTGLDTVDYSLDVRAGATHGITANLLAAAQGGLAADTVIGSFGDTDHVPNIRNLIGTQFADTILGGGRANVLQGGAGNDVIDGEGGSDTLTGGTGNDTFAFHLQSGGGGGGGIDTITDFSVADDTFRLENSVFTAFTTPGVMSDADFHAHILYNSATGALSYDANGVLAGGISQFATIGHGLILTHDDFLIA